MATYEQIQVWVKREYGYQPKTCWIADVKEICGLPMRASPNRKGKKRLHPCPKKHVPLIEEALKHFGMI
jgi:hypothetical protein